MIEMAMDYDCEELQITFEIRGYYYPKEAGKDSMVSDVKIYCGTLNMTSQINSFQNDVLEEIFLEYCDEEHEYED